MKKRIRLTIEWDGACSEHDWARVLRRGIERMDESALTRVVLVELRTNIGETPVRKLTMWERLRVWLRQPVTGFGPL